jgi:hypothetical protein
VSTPQRPGLLDDEPQSPAISRPTRLPYASQRVERSGTDESECRVTPDTGAVTQFRDARERTEREDATDLLMTEVRDP